MSSLRPTFHAAFPWVLIIFVIVGIFAVYVPLFSQPPIGWDAPYYMYKEKVLSSVDGDIDSHNTGRVGYVAFAAVLHSITGLSLDRTEFITPLIIVLALAVLTGLLFYDLFSNNTLALIVGFITALSSFSLHRLAQSLSDNLFSLFLFTMCAYLLLLAQKRSLSYQYLIAIPLVVMAFTHLESFVLTVLSFCLFLFIEFVLHQSLKNYFTMYWRVIFALGIGIIALVGNWGSGLTSFIDVYSPGIEVVSEPAVSESQLSNGTMVWEQLHTMFGVAFKPFYSIFLPLSILGIAVLVVKMKNSSVYSVFRLWFSWMCVLILIITFRDRLFSSLPVDRLFLMWPSATIIALAVIYLQKVLRKYLNFGQPTVLLTVAVLGILITFTYIGGLRSFFPKESFSSFPKIEERILNTVGVNYIFVTDLKPAEPNPMAWYYLYQNWINVYTPVSGSRACLYFGLSTDYPEGRSTAYSGDGYVSAHDNSVQCINAMNDSLITHVIILKHIAEETYKKTMWNTQGIEVLSDDAVIVIDESAFPKSLQQEI